MLVALVVLLTVPALSVFGDTAWDMLLQGVRWQPPMSTPMGGIHSTAGTVQGASVLGANVAAGAHSSPVLIRSGATQTGSNFAQSVAQPVAYETAASLGQQKIRRTLQQVHKVQQVASSLQARHPTLAHLLQTLATQGHGLADQEAVLLTATQGGQTVSVLIDLQQLQLRQLNQFQSQWAAIQSLLNLSTLTDDEKAFIAQLAQEIEQIGQDFRYETILQSPNAAIAGVQTTYQNASQLGQCGRNGHCGI
ncbi:MAG: hypothetical protein SFZ03_07630 [Candidatus Melainabacteria bacterium]|nr:hypothetical protein [Candidatus Melainabacteria bacterium]